ncbi:MAG TPA: trigger factor [Candidatus Angelobacter sp.]|nr:trigger factor [Candidatus Angelobacter sp.]
MTAKPANAENTEEKTTAEAPESAATATETTHNTVPHMHVRGEMNEACRREVAVEIPAEVTAKSMDNLVRQYSRAARVPGFRKGKVPAGVIRKRFAEDIKGEMIESLVPQYFRMAVEKQGYMPVSQPIVRDLEMEDGQPIRFKATFEVLPQIELGEYKGIKAEHPSIQVTDEEVHNELKQLQERHGSYDPVDEDRPLQDGDFAQVSFQATPRENEPEEGTAATEARPQPIQMDEVLVEIGGSNTVNEFSTNLRGAKAGEERIFDVAYPADFYDARLAGKTLHYTVKINAIKKKVVPELNDEFVREVSKDFQTVDELKGRIREGMQAERTHKAEHEAKEKLITELVEKHDFPVPWALVERQIDLRLERGLRMLAAQGMSTEAMRRMDINSLRGAQRDLAEKEVRSNLLLTRIAEAEGIDVTEEEVEQEVRIMARQMEQTPDAIRKRLMEDGTIDRIRNRMRSDKALDFLYNQPA